jgi:DNA-binding NarL/FixJ family response regulator
MDEGLDVVKAHNEPDGMKVLQNEDCNLVVCDLYLGEGTGFALMKYIQEQRPDIKCIVITGHASLDSAIRSLRKGAFDYLLKPFGYFELMESVRGALARQEVEASSARIDFDKFAKDYSLTKKETEVVRVVVKEGLANEDIAGKLNISRNTVKVHLRNIFKKVNVESKTALASRLLADSTGY